MILRCDTRRLPARSETGFTLIEMLVVLAILGFTVVLVIGYRPPWSKRLGVDAAAAQLAGQLRLARSAAIGGNTATTLELDLKGHTYHVGAMPPQPLPAEWSLQLLTIAGEREGSAMGGIRFNPDGSSTGGRIVLGDGSHQVAIGVDWLTGRIGVADVP